jgi:hypothetical protein
VHRENVKIVDLIEEHLQTKEKIKMRKGE